MELNPKLIQYSLEVKYCQSKIIQDQHNQHLKKLQQINRKPTLSKIKRQAQSLKNISESLNRYHEISRSFKNKQNEQKRYHQDSKMIKSLSQIQKKSIKTQKQHKEDDQFKKRKQMHNKIAHILKSKQLQEENIKIGLRIARQQNDFSYVKKINKDIKEYSRAKKNLIRIKDDHVGLSRMIKMNLQPHKNSNKVIKMLTQAEEITFNDDDSKGLQLRRQSNKVKTEAACEDGNQEDFLFEILKKHPSQILNQRQSEDDLQKQKKQASCLPHIKSSLKDIKKEIKQLRQKV